MGLGDVSVARTFFIIHIQITFKYILRILYSLYIVFVLVLAGQI